MRNKTLGINVRVTPAEKEKLTENASYCGLSLSEYLRKVGLGKEVKATLDERDYKAFRLIKHLKQELSVLNQEEIRCRLEAIESFIKTRKID